jgi:hypothetical protein
MLTVLFNKDLTIASVIKNENFYQNSVKINEMEVIAPLSNTNIVRVSFKLPDSEILNFKTMTFKETNSDLNLNVWRYTFEQDVLEQAGIVEFSIYIFSPTGQVITTGVSEIFVEKSIGTDFNIPSQINDSDVFITNQEIHVVALNQSEFNDYIYNQLIDITTILEDDIFKIYFILLNSGDFEIINNVYTAIKPLEKLTQNTTLLFDFIYDFPEGIELEVSHSDDKVFIKSLGYILPDNLLLTAVKLNTSFTSSGGSGGEGTTEHDNLSWISRSKANQHPISAISGLSKKIDIHIGDEEPVETVETWFDVIDSSGIGETSR